MNRKYNTNEIVETGLITGIIIVLMLITGYVPVLNIVSTLLLPVPVTVLALRRGYKLSFLSVVIGTILTAMAYNPITAVQSAIIFGLSGISLAYCIKNDKSFGETIMIMTIATSAALILSISLYIGFILKDGFNGVYSLMDKSAAMFKDSYEGMKKIVGTNNLNSTAVKQYEAQLKLLTADYFIKGLLGGILVCSMVIAYINYLVAEKILKRLKFSAKEPTPFRYINIDAKLGLAVVIIMFAGSILSYYKIPAGEYMYGSAENVLMFLISVQGISVLSYLFLEKTKIPKAGVIAIIVLGFSVISTVSIYLGLADLILDFRKINKNSLFNKRGK